MKKTLIVLSALGIALGSSYLPAGKPTARAAAQNTQTEHLAPAPAAAEKETFEADIALQPDAVIAPEKLHRAANLSYKVKGVRYYPDKAIKPFAEEGKASWYGEPFHGRLTTSGEVFNMHEMTAAHRTLPIPSYVRVTNLANDKSVVVRINDRGPFHGNRIIDLSYAAAKKLGYTKQGVAQVRIEQIIPQQQAQLQDGSYLTLASTADFKKAQYALHQATLEQGGNGAQKVSLVKKDGMYRIVIGPFHTEQTAEELRVPAPGVTDKT